MQSSARNSLKLRLRAATQSPTLRRVGDSGALLGAAVDKAETAGLGLRLALPALAEDEPHCRADPAAEQEADRQRTAGGRGELGAELRRDVRRLADLAPE